MAWKTIDTAPKDGTWIDAWRAPSKRSGMYWEPRVTVTWDEEEGAWVWPDDTYEVFSEQGRERANDAIIDGNWYVDGSFTHWMPLPDAPQ